MPSFQTVNEPSPLKEDNWQSKLQKKLFTDAEITDSQVSHRQTMWVILIYLSPMLLFF